MGRDSEACRTPLFNDYPDDAEVVDSG